jgi:hypothetical protein
MTGDWGYTYADWVTSDGLLTGYVGCTEQQARDRAALDLSVLVVFRPSPEHPWRVVEDAAPAGDVL